MNLTPEQLSEEKEYLEKVMEVLKELCDKHSDSIDSQIDSIQELKKYIWDNISELDDMEVAGEMYNVNTNVGYANKRIADLHQLKRSLYSPYFGRIDFKRDKSRSNRIQKIYVGLNGISKDLEHYVFDWRTPIASLFYNYGIGKVSYEAPAGTITGEVSLKRQYKIANGKLERCFDSDLNIDDEYLQEILSNASSDKMTNIVKTIQKEQNEIIRNLIDRYLIVQGIAGSGKTSVAMHRIAYLLYAEKDLTSNNVLIFSPNDVFSEYISNVLPELGEENVLQTTFSDFAKSYIKDYKQLESFTEFIERYYKNEDFDDEEFKTIKYKLSNEFKNCLDNAIASYKNGLSFSHGFIINDRFISKDELNQLFKEKLSRLPILERFDVLSENLCDMCGVSYKKYAKTIKKHLQEMMTNQLTVREIYSDVLKSEMFKNGAGVRKNVELKKGKKLMFEDLLPLLYINFEINGYPSGSSIKHIIIDEAQDYTILQLEMLKKIFTKSSFTILGDIHQTINPYYMYDSLNTINEIFDNQGRYIELNKTYRSSEEIIDFTNGILGINNACSVRKSNSIPVTVENIDQKDLVKKLKLEIDRMSSIGLKRVAIITKNNAQTLDIYDKLENEVQGISLINGDPKQKIGKIVVLPSYISKGLEFDGVIVYTDDEHKYSDKDKYLFYVVCTRAQHCLTIYNQKTLKKSSH